MIKCTITCDVWNKKNIMQKNKIILNYLPPAQSGLPSIALSILKSYLENNNYKCDVKYWNIILSDTLFAVEDNELNDLMPFFYILSNDFNVQSSPTSL